MMSEEEVRAEISAVLRDMEESDGDYQLKSYLNIVFNTLQWVIGSLSMDELITIAEEEAGFWSGD